MGHCLYKPHLQRQLYASVVTKSPGQLERLCKSPDLPFPFLCIFSLMFRRIFIHDQKNTQMLSFVTCTGIKLAITVQYKHTILSNRLVISPVLYKFQTIK